MARVHSGRRTRCCSTMVNPAPSNSPRISAGVGLCAGVNLLATGSSGCRALIVETATSPPGDSTRWNSRNAAGWSKKWNAEVVTTASTAAVVEGQLLGRAAPPLHHARSGAGLVEHALGHVHAVDRGWVQVALNPVSQNACAASDVDYPRRLVVAQLRDHLVVRRTVDPLLQERQVVGRGSHTPEPRDDVIETATLRRLRHLVEV